MGSTETLMGLKSWLGNSCLSGIPGASPDMPLEKMAGEDEIKYLEQYRVMSKADKLVSLLKNGQVSIPEDINSSIKNPSTFYNDDLALEVARKLGFAPELNDVLD